MHNKMPFAAFFLALLGCVCIGVCAVSVPPIFGDHAVLQRDIALPVWGTAGAGEKVTVKIAGKSATATADEQGNWSLKLPPLKKGEATSMTITGSDGKPIVLHDLLVGDVWICSGQSNMGFQTREANNAAKELAAARHPDIRFFEMGHVTALKPTKSFKGKWEICTPKTAADFSAVGYFFGRDINNLEDVPVGLINNSWGAMPAESFTSEKKLKSDPDLKSLLDRRADAMKPEASAERAKAEKAAAEWDKKYSHEDPGNKGFAKGFAKPDLDESDWKTIKLPQHIEDAGLMIDGAIWFRKQVDIPADFAGKALSLQLGGIDDEDTTYFDGKQVGRTAGLWAVFIQRDYTIPASDVKAGKATIAVRVFDKNGAGGFYSQPSSMKLALKSDDTSSIPLSGEWKYKIEKSWPQAKNIPPCPPVPQAPDSPFFASNIFNAIVYPIIPYGIKGVIWYQGESNADRAEQYRTLFPAMIEDWRQRWGEGDFPFLFVQLANFGNGKPRPSEPTDSTWAELREAQTMTLKKLPNTAMAVTIDIGESRNIHPKNKQDVSKRLALGAEKIAYGKATIEDAGPMYESMKVEDNAIRLHFTHADGLKARGGKPEGFAIAGKDQKFHWANAKIEGSDIIVSSPDVSHPVAVRYGWADDPKVNMYNGADLPMSPFRTDDWKMITAGKK